MFLQSQNEVNLPDKRQPSGPRGRSQWEGARWWLLPWWGGVPGRAAGRTGGHTQAVSGEPAEHRLRQC